MPRLPTMRVTGSQAISTRSVFWVVLLVPGIVDVITPTSLLEVGVGRSYQVRLAPVTNCVPGLRHLGSWSTVCAVTLRSLRRVDPHALTTFVESLPPGGSSMKGMNLSGNPGM